MLRIPKYKPESSPVDATGGSRSPETGPRRRRAGVFGVIGVRAERAVCGVWGERSSIESGREKDPRRSLTGELSRLTSIPIKVFGAHEASIHGLSSISNWVYQEVSK
jgi:hypothetical protein